MSKLKQWLHQGSPVYTENQVVSIITVKFILGMVTGFALTMVWVV